MSQAFYHEELHRTADLMRRLRDVPVTVCGAGALGANLTENLARQGFGTITVIDRDRVEERNLSTQPFYRSDIGAAKAKLLANALYRALGVAVTGKVEELTPANAVKLLTGASLIIDTFDNSIGRQAVKNVCAARGVPCLHIGLATGYAEAVWNEEYRVPSASNDDVCDYPLARNLVLLAVAAASELIVGWAATGERRSFTLTLDDLTMQAFPGG